MAAAHTSARPRATFYLRAHGNGEIRAAEAGWILAGLAGMSVGVAKMARWDYPLIFVWAGLAAVSLMFWAAAVIVIAKVMGWAS